MTNEKNLDLADLQSDYDWDEVFKYAPPGVTRADVVEVVGRDDGENDGAEWIGLFLLRDGRYLYIEAGCDYTGWGCQEGGRSELFATRLAAIQSLGDTERYRMGLKMEY